MPGTKARDFEAKLDTLKANIGFDRLQKMRDESPTGGALGQVSEMELRQLNAALGGLDQSQSPEQLRENLLRIRDHYIRAVSALEAEYARSWHRHLVENPADGWWQHRRKTWALVRRPRSRRSYNQKLSNGAV